MFSINKEFMFLTSKNAALNFFKFCGGFESHTVFDLRKKLLNV